MNRIPIIFYITALGHICCVNRHIYISKNIICSFAMTMEVDVGHVVAVLRDFFVPSNVSLLQIDIDIQMFSTVAG